MVPIGHDVASIASKAKPTEYRKVWWVFSLSTTTCCGCLQTLQIVVYLVHRLEAIVTVLSAGKPSVTGQ